MPAGSRMPNAALHDEERAIEEHLRELDEEMRAERTRRLAHSRASRAAASAPQGSAQRAPPAGLSDYRKELNELAAPVSAPESQISRYFRVASALLGTGSAPHGTTQRSRPAQATGAAATHGKYLDPRDVSFFRPRSAIAGYIRGRPGHERSVPTRDANSRAAKRPVARRKVSPRPDWQDVTEREPSRGTTEPSVDRSTRSARLRHDSTMERIERLEREGEPYKRPTASRASAERERPWAPLEAPQHRRSPAHSTLPAAAGESQQNESRWRPARQLFSQESYVTSFTPATVELLRARWPPQEGTTDRSRFRPALQYGPGSLNASRVAELASYGATRERYAPFPPSASSAAVHVSASWDEPPRWRSPRQDETPRDRWQQPLEAPAVPSLESSRVHHGAEAWNIPGPGFQRADLFQGAVPDRPPSRSRQGSLFDVSPQPRSMQPRPRPQWF